MSASVVTLDECSLLPLDLLRLLLLREVRLLDSFLWLEIVVIA